LLRTIASHSPIAWSHINLLGEYDLSDEKLIDSIGILNPKLPPGIIAEFLGERNSQKIT